MFSEFGYVFGILKLLCKLICILKLLSVQGSQEAEKFCSWPTSLLCKVEWFYWDSSLFFLSPNRKLFYLESYLLLHASPWGCCELLMIQEIYFTNQSLSSVLQYLSQFFLGHSVLHLVYVHLKKSKNAGFYILMQVKFWSQLAVSENCVRTAVQTL